MLILLAAAACGDDGSGGETVETLEAAMTIDVTSSEFEEGGRIPTRFTCDGDDVSPPLAWSGVPAGVAELALLVEDPDAPRGTFVHWVVWGIDPSATGLTEGDVPAGAREGRSDFGRAGYGGPCPPPGDPHRYLFTLLAVSEPLDLGDDATAADVRRAAESVVAAQGQLTGVYGR